jgi:TRAP-type C4-dicarboxylate transport system permease small subunit
MWSLFEYIQNKMKIIAAACLMIMVFLTCINVVGRLCSYPIFGTEELVAIFATFAVALTLPYAHKKDAHIGVEILMRLFSKKNQKLVKFITDILAFGLFIIVTWRMSLYAHTIQKSGEVSMNLGLPEYYVIYIVSFCFFIFTMFIFKDIIRFFKKAEKNI